jgi:hypothetical protein
MKFWLSLDSFQDLAVDAALVIVMPVTHVSTVHIVWEICLIRQKNFCL